MIAAGEDCIQALRPYLDEGQKTVGIHVDFSHGAATPRRDDGHGGGRAVGGRRAQTAVQGGLP